MAEVNVKHVEVTCDERGRVWSGDATVCPQKESLEVLVDPLLLTWLADREDRDHSVLPIGSSTQVLYPTPLS